MLSRHARATTRGSWPRRDTSSRVTGTTRPFAGRRPAGRRRELARCDRPTAPGARAQGAPNGCRRRPNGSGRRAAASEGAAFPWGNAIPSWIPDGGRGPLPGPWPVTLGEPNAFGLLRDRGQHPRVVRRLARSRLLRRGSRRANPRGPEAGCQARVARRIVAARHHHQPLLRPEQDRSVVSLHGLRLQNGEERCERSDAGRGSSAEGGSAGSRSGCGRPAVARWSSAAGSATSCWGIRRRTSISKSTASTPERLKQVLAAFGSVNTVGESFTVYKVAGLDVSIPRTESKSGRGHKGFAVRGDPSLSPADGGAPPRLHHQRHLLGSADRRIHRPVRRPLGSRAAAPARRRSARRSPTTACACCARSSSRRGSSSRSTNRTKALCRSLPLDDLPAERIWGEIEKLLLRARRPSIGFALALELGVIDRLLPGTATRSSAARRSPSGTPRATCGYTRCWSSTKRARASTTSTTRSR